jgi:hypothetical protein
MQLAGMMSVMILRRKCITKDYTARKAATIYHDNHNQGIQIRELCKQRNTKLQPSCDHNPAQWYTLCLT